MILISAALLAAMQTMPEYAVVVVSEGRKGCEFRAEGRRMTQAQLEHRAKVWAGQRRKGEVQSRRDLSFTCIGQAMLIMQNAGIEKVTYTGRPIGRSVDLFVPASKGCTPMVNGEAMTLDALRPLAARWGRDRAEVHFQPDPKAGYECVDAVLKILKETSGIEIGFIGNEAPAQ
jgi:hypothetical protein